MMEEPIDDHLIDPNLGEYKFYRNFMNVDEAKGFAALLDESDILYKLETTDTLLDTAFVGTGLVPKAVIKLLPKDFKAVNAIISEEIDSIAYSDVEDHYLNQMDNEELQEIFVTQDEWSSEDISIAKVILHHRGVGVSDDEISKMRAERLVAVRAGKDENTAALISYGLFTVFGILINVVFVLAGTGMGYYYAYGKDTDADGNQYYIYKEKTRIAGTFIFYVGLIACIVMLGLYLYGEYTVYEYLFN